MTVREAMAMHGEAQRDYRKACGLIAKASQQMKDADAQDAKGGQIVSHGQQLRERSAHPSLSLEASDEMKNTGSAEVSEGRRMRDAAQEARRKARDSYATAERFKAQASQCLDQANEALKAAIESDI